MTEHTDTSDTDSHTDSHSHSDDEPRHADSPGVTVDETALETHTESYVDVSPEATGEQPTRRSRDDYQTDSAPVSGTDPLREQDTDDAEQPTEYTYPDRKLVWVRFEGDLSDGERAARTEAIAGTLGPQWHVVVTDEMISTLTAREARHALGQLLAAAGFDLDTAQALEDVQESESEADGEHRRGPRSPMNDTEESDLCPACDHPFNHVVRNGHRNRWPGDVDFHVCTTDDSDHMWVHTRGDPDDDYWDDTRATRHR